MAPWARAMATVTTVFFVACGTTGGGTPDGAGRTDGAAACSTAADCNDGLFCNGEESCDPSSPAADGRGCTNAAEPRCASGQTCDEVTDACLADCSEASDADGDGHAAARCGGDDCDDGDPDRFPGNVEVCDADNRDEDCDATTFGDRDADGDGAVDALCCNVDGTSTRCGDDCDDTRRGVNPDTSEVCDGFDNNCDGSVDEGVILVFHPDADGDGYGEAGSSAVMGCVGPPGTAGNDLDCDDSAPRVNPGADEACDVDGSGALQDTDCDGAIDEGLPLTQTCYRDVDGDGSGDPTVSMMVCDCPAAGCGCPTGSALDAGDCCDMDPGANPSASPRGVPHACGGFDWNCDGTVEMLSDRTTTCSIFDCSRCTAPFPMGGWLGAVPACGAMGTLVCCGIDSSGGCVELSRTTRVQLCR